MVKIFLDELYKTFKTIITYDDDSIMIGVLFSTMGTFLTYIIGGFDYPLLMLVGFVITDYITGFISGAKNNKISSDIMYWGIIRKVSQLLVVALGVALDRLMNTDTMVIRLMIIYFYIGMEGISILENLVNIGVKVPKKLVLILEKIRENDQAQSNECIRDETNNALVEFGVKKRKKNLGQEVD